jgi:hypothetical protein
MFIINALKNNRRPKEMGDRQVFAEDLIRSLQTPCAAAEVSEIKRMIEVEAAQVDEACRQETHTAMETARQNHKQLQAQVQEHRPSVERAKSEFEKAESNRGNFILIVTAIAFFIACMVAEWDITWTTLPYSLGIKQHSFAGVMLSLAPTTGLAILKVVIAILIWDPWQKLRSEASASPRKAPKIVMALFLIVVGAFTVFTIAMLAEARSEIVKLKDQVRNESRVVIGASEKKVAADKEKINRAVYVVSICLAINGALFFLIGLTELNKLTAYLRSLVILAWLWRRQAGIEVKLAQAETHLAEKTKDWENIEVLAKNRAEHYCARLSLMLEQMLKRPRQAPSYRELVAERLAANI